MADSLYLTLPGRESFAFACDNCIRGIRNDCFLQEQTEITENWISEDLRCLRSLRFNQALSGRDEFNSGHLPVNMLLDARLCLCYSSANAQKSSNPASGCTGDVYHAVAAAGGIMHPVERTEPGGMQK